MLLALGYCTRLCIELNQPYLPILSPSHVNYLRLKCSIRFLASNRTLFDNGTVDSFRRDIQSQTFVGETHLLGKSGVRLPGGGIAGVSLFHHLVDLLERETFGFGLKGGMLACANLVKVRL